MDIKEVEEEVKSEVENVEETTEDDGVENTETVTETVQEEPRHVPEYSHHDFGWESLASVEESRQNQLISEVYSIMNTGDDEKLEFIKREWNSLSEEGIDQALEERFKQAVHRYETRQERLEEAQEIKRRLIVEASKLKDSTDWNKTSKSLQDLQSEWKEAGFAGQDIDQELWEEFRGINDQFFDRRSAHYENLAESREETKSIKEQLIEDAEAIKDSQEWKKTSTDMRNLMTKWKEAGFAGREHEDDLWERFNSARQHFYQKQREFFDAMRETQRKAQGIKESIIVRAEELVKTFDDSTTREKMETLFDEWKEAGHSGRDVEEKLWNEFRAIQDDFYDKLKSRDFSRRETRRSDAQNDLEVLEVRISALEGLNEKIEIKLDSIKGQMASNDSEELQEEFDELTATLSDNKARLEEYQDEYNKLVSEVGFM